jgi:uncharacterized protein YktB (UPF0637 family)
MDTFGAFFQLHPISDDSEYLAMKLFSATLHGNARRWHDSLPYANIISMDQLDETFLKIWNIKIQDINMLINKLNNIKKSENETVKEFHDRFRGLVQQILASYHLSHNFLLFLYTKSFTGQIGFPIIDKSPITIQEVYDMS